jgi:hypothetical protein
MCMCVCVYVYVYACVGLSSPTFPWYCEKTNHRSTIAAAVKIQESVKKLEMHPPL